MKNMSLFSQILSLIPRSLFKSLASQFGVEYRSKGFSSWDQFVSMLFCQFAQASSLREITMGLQSCEGKLSHLGMSAPKRSTLSYANQNRPWEFYQGLFESLLGRIRSEVGMRNQNFNFKNKLFSIDASTIDLCLTVFDWAKFRTTKGAIKLHVRLDHDGYLPDFIIVTDGKVHDVTAAWSFPYERGSITVFDRGYVDYSLFKHIHNEYAFFVTRLKKNAAYTTLEELVIPSEADDDIISDSIIKLKSDEYIEPLRIIRVIDVEGRTIQFLTNNFELDAETISEIYRERWQIELFFKELKQNLKIKTFVGTSKNAVMTQIYTALISILLFKYMKVKSSFGWSMSNLVTMIRMNLFTHKDLWGWIEHPFDAPPDKDCTQVEQMEISFGQQAT